MIDEREQALHPRAQGPAIENCQYPLRAGQARRMQRDVKMEAVEMENP